MKHELKVLKETLDKYVSNDVGNFNEHNEVYSSLEAIKLELEHSIEEAEKYRKAYLEIKQQLDAMVEITSKTYLKLYPEDPEY